MAIATRVLASLTPLAVLLTACRENPAADLLAPPPLAPAAAAAAVMLGTWSYTDPPRMPSDEPSLNAGLHVTLTIDDADGSSFRGAVVSWFAGDVGAPPGTFGPLEGAVEADGRVTLTIPVQRSGVPALTLVGRVVRDTLTIDASQQGAEPGPFAAGSVFARPPLSLAFARWPSVLSRRLLTPSLG